jgi:putative oxidoreductase
VRVIQGILAFVGRLMISIIFLLSALGNKIPNFSSVADVMASKGMPQDEILGIPAHKYLLCGAIVFLILGGLSVAAGFKARLGACMLFLFLIGATYYFHDFWNAEADQQPAEMIQFLKNLALSGTMLFLIANGAGPGSLDHRKNSKNMREAIKPGSRRTDKKQNGNTSEEGSGTFTNLKSTTPGTDSRPGTDGRSV